jgi:hypothetical protein
VLGARGSVVSLTVGIVGNGALFHVRTSRVLWAEYPALGGGNEWGRSASSKVGVYCFPMAFSYGAGAVVSLPVVPPPGGCSLGLHLTPVAP